MLGSHLRLLRCWAFQHHKHCIHVLWKRCVVVLQVDTERKILGKHVRCVRIHAKIAPDIDSACKGKNQGKDEHPTAVAVAAGRPVREKVVSAAVRSLVWRGHPWDKTTGFGTTNPWSDRIFNAR